MYSLVIRCAVGDSEFEVMFVYTIQDIACGGLIVIALLLMIFAWANYTFKEWLKKRHSAKVDE
jgi:hypothetical protein